MKVKHLFILLLIPILMALTAFHTGPASPKMEEIGIASYYHKKFNGRKTFSGAVFHNDSLTGAHKRLAMGTRVKVTNLKNDSCVVITINDRLPKTSKRTIDLSQRAAHQLNFMKAGLTKVKIEVLSGGN